MGNDGGSIPTRGDLVRTKAKAEQVDKWASTLIAWFTCALSKRPLEQPIVSCSLGRLYNKDSLLQYLLNPSPSDPDSPFGVEGSLIAGHVRSLNKDTTTLSLTPNPSLTGARTASKSGIESTNASEKARWVCPITLREMNGSVRFVYVRGCGCTLSETALKELKGSTPPDGQSTQAPSPSTSASTSTSTSAPTSVGMEACPVCGRPADEAEKAAGGIRSVVINPGKEESDRMREQMEVDRAAAKAANGGKKERASKKRKKADLDADVSANADDAANGTITDDRIPHFRDRDRDWDDDTDEPKKLKLDRTAGAVPVSVSARDKPTVATPAAVKAELAKLREKQKSAAVQSLYAKKEEDATKDRMGRSNWMLMGTFNRYA